MSLQILDPTYEGGPVPFTMAERLPTLEGATIGLISNGKHGTSGFFDALERRLSEQGAAEIVRVTKTNYSAPADREIMDRAREWNALVAGVGD